MDRTRLFAMFFVLAVSGGLVLWINTELETPSRKRPRETGTVPRPPDEPKDTTASSGGPTMRDVAQVIRRDPEEGMRLCREIIEGDDPEESRKARDLLERTLAEEHEKALRAQKPERAGKLREELEERFSGGRYWRRARNQWVQHQMKQIEKAVGEGAFDRADELVETLLATSMGRAEAHRLRKYESSFRRRHRKAVEAGRTDEAEEWLRRWAAFSVPLGRTAALERFFRKQETPDSLKEKAKAARAADEHELAFVFLRALHRQTPSRKQEPIQKQLWELRIGLAERYLAEGKPAWAKRMAGRHPLGAEEKEPFLELLFDAEVALGRQALLKNDFEMAEGHFRRALRRQAIELWLVRVELRGGDPWTMLPVGLKKKWRALFPGEKRPNDVHMFKASAFPSHLVREEFQPPLPEAEAVRSSDLPALFARWGLERLKRLRPSDTKELDRALSNLRTAVRLAPGADIRSAIRTELEEQIQEAGRRSDPALLVELVGFFVTELGPVAEGDAFRSTLKKLLQKAARSVGEGRDTMRLYLLTLLADAIPGDSAAEKARKEAVTLGLRVAARAGGEGLDRPGNAIPSGLPACGLHIIDNDTPYHLLCFYDGRERFFVRLAPRRRGTVVLREGPYRVAVLASRDTIRPYSGKVTWKAETIPTRYHVKKQGGPSLMSVSSRGDYRLLRAPRDLGEVRIDPKTGAIRR